MAYPATTGHADDPLSSVCRSLFGCNVGDLVFLSRSFHWVFPERSGLSFAAGTHLEWTFGLSICTTQIAASDNIPVFAWLRLRGRCRTCRLPISIQYPLVELAVGLVFLAMYFLEFGIAGTNLPGPGTRPQGIGLIWMSVDRPLVIRVLLALYLLSGLIAAALMVVRGSRVPLALVSWLGLVLVLTPLIFPEAIVVPWWGVPSAKSISVVDAGFSLATGMLSGILLGALTLPLLCRSHNNGENNGQTVDDPMSSWAWMGAVVCLGLLVGWQALPMVVAWILVTTMVARVFWHKRDGELLRELGNR